MQWWQASGYRSRVEGYGYGDGSDVGAATRLEISRNCSTCCSVTYRVCSAQANPARAGSPCADGASNLCYVRTCHYLLCRKTYLGPSRPGRENRLQCREPAEPSPCVHLFRGRGDNRPKRKQRNPEYRGDMGASDHSESCSDRRQGSERHGADPHQG